MFAVNSGLITESQRIDLKRSFPEIPRNKYLTHGFDSYPAKMIPHMARYLINGVSNTGQIILDPFCGSGAVLIESLLSGRNAMGVDLNPLAILFAKAKTTIYDPHLLEIQLEELLDQFIKCRYAYQYNFPNASYWFTPATLRKLGVIKTVLDRHLPNIEPDYAFFWLAVMATIVRECSRADTRGPKPFISKKAREERLEIDFDPFKKFESKARSWIEVEHEYSGKLNRNGIKPRIEVIEGDSRNLSKILNGKKVDAVVTSPPYLNAQDYYRSCKLQLFILGHASPAELREWSRDLIGSDRIFNEQALLAKELPCPLAEMIKSELAERNKKNAQVFAKYILDMSKVLQEINSVLKDNSYCAIVSGYNLISGITIPTPEVINQLASKEGFQLTRCCRDRIRDRWVPTIRNGHNAVITEEYLLVFKKSV